MELLLFLYFHESLSTHQNFHRCRRGSGADPELDFGGHNPELDFGGFKFLFHVESFLTLLFAIGNIAIWVTWPPDPPLEGAIFLPMAICLNKYSLYHFFGNSSGSRQFRRPTFDSYSIHSAVTSY